jgi:hypothetical protein
VARFAILTATSLLLGCRQQLSVIPGHCHANGDDAANVKQNDADQRLVDSARHVPAGVRGLAECNANQFRAEIGEGGLHDRRPDAQEASKSAIVAQLLSKSARVFPVPETTSVVIGSATQGKYEAQENDHDDDQSLDK